MTVRKSVLAVSAAFVAGLAFADLPSIDNLNLSTNAWFSAPSTGGSWSPAAPGAGETSGYSEVDSTLAAPLTFGVTAASATTNVFNEISFDMLAAYVPQTVSLSAPENAKVGFAIKKWLDSDVLKTNYCYYAGNDWVYSGTAVSVAEGAACKLVIQVDRRYAPGKVRFLLNGSDVCGGWQNLSTGVGATANVDFVGSGEIKGLAGKIFTIVSENIEINPGTGGGKVVVSIPDADMGKIRAEAGSTSVGEYLAQSSGKNGLTRLDGEVLFGKTTLTEADKATVKGEPVQATSGKVRIKVADLNVKAVGGATVTYELQGSVNGTDGWEKVVKTTDTTALEFSQDTTNRFFRVVTTVTYGNN